MKAEESNITEEVREIIPTPEFDEFFYAQDKRVQKKLEYVIDVMATVYNVPTKFVKYLQNSELYEMRVSIGTNEYRTVLFTMDHPNFIEATKILLLNGFLKKSEKDYRKQIEIARKILNDLQTDNLQTEL